MDHRSNGTVCVNSEKHRVRNDLALIVSLLVIVSFVGLGMFFFRGEGNSVLVTVDGQPFGVYRLSDDVTVDIKTGKDGERVNRLVIQDGRAFVEYASCPDGICASHRPILRNGESIVCLPNRVVITVQTEDTVSPDIIA